MNDVKTRLYFNRYCSTCRYRYPNVEVEKTDDDECVHPDVLTKYNTEKYNLCGVKALDRQIIAVECKKILRFCEGKYYAYRKPL